MGVPNLPLTAARFRMYRTGGITIRRYSGRRLSLIHIFPDLPGHGRAKSKGRRLCGGTGGLEKVPGRLGSNRKVIMYRGTGCLKIEFPPNSLIIYGTENECSSFSVPFSQLLLKEHLQTLGFEAAPFLPLGILPAACSISPVSYTHLQHSDTHKIFVPGDVILSFHVNRPFLLS